MGLVQAAWRFLCLWPIAVGAALWGIGPAAPAGANAAVPENPSVIPIGLDAYRQWDRWPVQRIGERAYLRSTYDRSGGNEGADASHFLYQLADDRNVTLDLEGPGVVYFVRTNHWHGSPWHYVVDGIDHVVEETSTADPRRPAENSQFLPSALFPSPLAFTWATTKGSDLNWVPIAYQKSFQLAYSRTRYGTGYYIYHQFVEGTALSQPIRTWDGKAAPDSDVLDLISRSGTDLAPKFVQGAEPSVVETHGLLRRLGPGGQTIIDILRPDRPGQLRALEFSVSADQAVMFGRARIRITWDDRSSPSVDAPVALFFGAGTLYNRDNREFLVKAFPVNVRYHEGRVRLACYFPMPFFKSAKIELIGTNETELADVDWSIRSQALPARPNQVGYFHATFRDHGQPIRGRDLVFLDTRTTEGGGDWTGSIVGTSFVFSDRANLTTLEGDPRFFFDDSRSPQVQGTGTEEWGGGGDYWGGLNMTLPFAGHPVGAQNAVVAKCAEDQIESAYRFLLADLMPFGKNALIQFEHGGTDESSEHYRSITYWYGLPGASLVRTDRLQIGDDSSEKTHRYVSPGATPPYVIDSRYELGVDHLTAAPSPSAQPANDAEFEFDAESGLTFAIWALVGSVQGRTLDGAFWMQFDGDIGTSQTAPGYTDARGFGAPKAIGSSDGYGWTGAQPPAQPRTISFARTGRHRLRVQSRNGQVRLAKIWLSSTQDRLPSSDQRLPLPSPREIVLHATDVRRVKGSVTLIADRSAAGQTVLQISGQAPSNASQIEVFPSERDRGRKTVGVSEFTLKTEPRNLGVLLRRKLDYAFPGQRAEVFVSDDNGKPFDWHRAGVWYLAGSNACVYSNPPDELGPAQHIVEVSNRRFRDDEFLIPRALTEGRSSLRVRIRFTPVKIPLFPGCTLPELGWSEIRYDAYCFVMPEFP